MMETAPMKRAKFFVFLFLCQAMVFCKPQEGISTLTNSNSPASASNLLCSNIWVESQTLGENPCLTTDGKEGSNIYTSNSTDIKGTQCTRFCVENSTMGSKIIRLATNNNLCLTERGHTNLFEMRHCHDRSGFPADSYRTLNFPITSEHQLFYWDYNSPSYIQNYWQNQAVRIQGPIGSSIQAWNRDWWVLPKFQLSLCAVGRVCMP